ncbi:MAG: ABC transporter permease [Alkaliphilus sp.]
MIKKSVNGNSKDTKRVFSEDMFELVQVEDKIKDHSFETKPVGYYKDALIRFCKNGASVLSLVGICTIILFATIGPSMNEFGFNDQGVERINMPTRIPFIEDVGIADGSRFLLNRRKDFLEDRTRYPEGSILEVVNEREVLGVQLVDVKVNVYKRAGIENYFWLGTDYLGRDLWTRLWRGARVSLLIAFISVATNVFIGVIYGAIAGYYGGKVDMVMVRIAEIISAFPRIVIITLFILYFGTGIFAIIAALIIKGWVGTALMIRAQFYRFKRWEYVLAARTLGVSDMALIFRHILPNAIGPIITRAMLAIPGAIFAESFLAFIGLGLQAPEPSIGVLLSHGQKVLLHFPNQVFFPALLISILMISFNLFANGLRDAFDPTLRGS